MSESSKSPSAATQRDALHELIAQTKRDLDDARKYGFTLQTELAESALNDLLEQLSQVTDHE